MTQQQMMSETEFFALLDTMGQEESKGGGGLIGRITYTMGYNSFAPGKSPRERWFPFPAKDQARRDEALAAALALGANVDLSYGFLIERSTVKDRDVSHWQHPFLYEITTHYFDDVKAIIKPALRELKLFTWPIIFWGHLAYKPSTRINPKSGKREPVAYPAKMFKDEAEAEKAAEAFAQSKGEKAIPGSSAAEGPPAWLVKYVKDPEHPGRQSLDPNKVAKIAEDLGQDVAMIIAALGA